MFQGASELTLDAKGRVAVPTRHRDALASAGGTVVLTAHPDRCVLLYPRLSWEQGEDFHLRIAVPAETPP